MWAQDLHRGSLCKYYRKCGLMAKRDKETPQNDTGNYVSPEDTEGSAKKPVRSRKASDADTVEMAARKARSAAKKVAAAVSETVKEIAEKVTGKKSSPRPKTASAADENPAAPAPRKSTRPAETTTSSAEPIQAKTVRKATKTAAMAEGTTSEDVRKTLLSLANSEDVPAESNEEVESATDVREHYFDAQPAGPPPPQPPRDLPDEYGDTRLVLLVRDPEWIYAYWEINDETRSHINFPRNGESQNRLVLRIYKVTDTSWPVDSAHYFFDVEVPRDARNWYIHLPEADQQWCSELGLIDHQDNYEVICRSNAVVTPRNTISEHVDSDWMTVEESFEKITRLSRASVEAQLRDGNAAGSEAILRTINRQLTAVLHGEKAALSSGIFSSEAAAPMKNQNFWLQVHTELILYGATEPDALVTVQGRDVTLNEDGTFSMRFALPDGLQVLDVRAVNAAGDLEESVTPVVERTTR